MWEDALLFIPPAAKLVDDYWPELMPVDNQRLKFELNEFGPLFVAMDANGNSVYAQCIDNAQKKSPRYLSNAWHQGVTSSCFRGQYLVHLPRFHLAKGDIPMNQIIDAILSRRSIRKYTDEPVSPDDLNQIIQCGLYAANGGNHQVVHLTALARRDLLDQLTALVRGEFLKMTPQEGLYQNIAIRNAHNRPDSYDFSLPCACGDHCRCSFGLA